MLDLSVIGFGEINRGQRVVAGHAVLDPQNCGGGFGILEEEGIVTHAKPDQNIEL